MIRAIVWKELREQGLIALTLVVLGGGVLVAAATLADPPAPGATPDGRRPLPRRRPARHAHARGHRRDGLRRGRVRRRAGGRDVRVPRLAPGQLAGDSGRPSSLAGLGLAVVADRGYSSRSPRRWALVPTPGWAVAVVLYSLLAFVWGMFGSTTARTTLGSVGVAIPAAILTAFFVLIPVTSLLPEPRARACRE